MSLSTLAADDADFFAEEFGEEVVVFGLSGGDRTVEAVVIRGTARSEQGQAHKTRAWECRIDFLDDDTQGSSATGVGYHEIRDLEKDGRRWSIRLAEDNATERWDFVEVVSNDAGGMVTCRFRRKQIVKSQQRPFQL